MKEADTKPYFLSRHVATWGDSAQGGKVTVDPSKGPLALDFETGEGWGWASSCPAEAKPRAAPGPADYRGYNFLEFKAFVPKDTKFQVYLTESGAGDPAGTDFKGKYGADGESYSFPAFQGTGKWTTYRVDFNDLERRTTWATSTGTISSTSRTLRA